MNVKGGLERVRSGNFSTRTRSGATPAASAASPPGRETLGRGPAESRHRPQVHGAPRRRLRRRRRRRGLTDRDPASVLQGGGEAAPVRRRPLPQARGRARRRRPVLLRRRDPAQDRAGPRARPRGARRRAGRSSSASARSRRTTTRCRRGARRTQPGGDRAGPASRSNGDVADGRALALPAPARTARAVRRPRGSTSTSRRSRRGSSATRGC